MHWGLASVPPFPSSPRTFPTVNPELAVLSRRHSLTSPSESHVHCSSFSLYSRSPIPYPLAGTVYPSFSSPPYIPSIARIYSTLLYHTPFFLFDVPGPFVDGFLKWYLYSLSFQRWLSLTVLHGLVYRTPRAYLAYLLQNTLIGFHSTTLSVTAQTRYINGT